MINDQQYKDMARAVVNEAGGCGTLLDGLCKLASDMCLNPHETRRLIEYTNVTAHTQYFEKMAAKDHRYVEFEVVDPKIVMERVFGQSEVAGTDSTLKTASAAPDTHRSLESWHGWHMLGEETPFTYKFAAEESSEAEDEEAEEEGEEGEDEKDEEKDEDEDGEENDKEKSPYPSTWEDREKARQYDLEERTKEELKIACLQLSDRIDREIAQMLEPCRYVYASYREEDVIRAAKEVLEEHEDALLKRASALLPHLDIASVEPEPYYVSSSNHATWTKLASDYDRLCDMAYAYEKLLTGNS